MKLGYCSLKDAFKNPDFYKDDETITFNNKELHTIPYTIQQTEQIKENFEEEQSQCDMIAEHLKSCSKCSLKLTNTTTIFNDFLNIILIILLIWIIIYKPNI